MIKNFLKKILRHVQLKASTASSCLVSLNDVPILFQPTSLLLNEVALTFSGSVPPDNPPKIAHRLEIFLTGVYFIQSSRMYMLFKKHITNIFYLNFS